MRQVLAIAFIIAAAGCSKSKTDSSPPPPPKTTDTPAAPASAPATAPVPATSPACEQARDQYLAWSADRVTSAIGAEPDEMKAELQAEADKEMARAKDAFVPACMAMGSTLDVSCFEIKHGLDRDRKCREVVAELERRMFGH